MNNRKENTKNRYREIYKDYRHYYDEQFLRHERCIQLLCDKHLLSESAIKQIVQEEKRNEKMQLEVA